MRGGRRPAGAAVAIALAALLLPSCRTGGDHPPVAGGGRAPAVAVEAAAPPVVAVAGNRLVDGNGAPLQLRGVNRSGAEYACIQGWGFFDGPTDDASVAAIAAWGANAVRLPLNEDCWLGVGTPDPAWSGDAYRAAVGEYVERLHRHGLAVVLDLHWAETPGKPATAQGKLPDAARAPAFWSSVAAAFAADRSVLFDLFNEPYGVSWDCWRDGCSLDGGWRAAGMQALVDAVRSSGARQPVIAGGLDYANDLSGWLAHAPTDPAGQLVAGFHLYNFKKCSDAGCWAGQVAPVAASVPVVAGEVGEDDRSSRLLRSFLPWADAHGVSYLGWTWDVWDDPVVLISDYTGTATAFGAGLRDHLLARAPATVPAPAAAGAPLQRGRPTFSSPSFSPPGSDRPWRSKGYPCWLAYDLAGVPAASRATVYSVWRNDATSNYDSAVFPAPTYNLPGDYVIEANDAPSAPEPPAAGWRTLVRVTGNTYHSAAHLLDLAGDTWLRFRATAGDPANDGQNDDCGLRWDVYDAAATDGWMFYGDSITAGAMGADTGTSSFGTLVQAEQGGRAPAEQSGGVGGITLDYAVTHGLFAKWLPAFPGRYAAVSLGTNDANTPSFDAARFERNLDAAVSAVEAAGKVAVVPTLVASTVPNIQANGPLVNEIVARVLHAHPAALAGPDLWGLFRAHPEWISGDDLHPDGRGYAEIRRAWARTVASVGAADAGRPR